MKTYEIRLKKEFDLLKKLQLHPNVKPYLTLYYKERLGGGNYKPITSEITSKSTDDKGLPCILYPNKFKFTYTMPMYLGVGQLKEDWSASFLIDVPESVLMDPNKSLNMEIEGGSFKEKPFNNHCTNSWVCTGTIWDIAQGCGLWYFVMSVGCLLNQDRIVTPADASDEHRHLSAEAFRYWKNDRHMQPITDIKWPFNLDSVIFEPGGVSAGRIPPKPKFVIGKSKAQTEDVEPTTGNPTKSTFVIGNRQSINQEQPQKTASTFVIGATKKI